MRRRNALATVSDMAGSPYQRMRITLLGTGGPRPDPDRQAPANLVQAGGLNIVVDAGRGVASQLAKAGVRMPDLDVIVVTHHHFDHIGGLGDLIMSAWNIGRADPIRVFGPPGTLEVISTLLEGVYWRDVNYRIVEEKAQGHSLSPPIEMLEITEVMEGTVDLGSGVALTVGEVEHGSTVLNLSLEDWATIGCRIEFGGRSVAISGDAVAGKQLHELAKDVDLLVMCAYVAASEIDNMGTRFLTEHVIAGAPQAAQIAQRAAVARLALTHIREKTDSDVHRMRDEVAGIFTGQVIAGTDMLVIEIP